MLIQPYDSGALQRLSERTDYEAWFLEAVYTIGEDDLFPTFPDGVIYPSNGASPEYIRHMRGRAVIGDWRSGFLGAGAPLVFVTAFKLLDMIMEWVLGENGATPSFRFQEKIARLSGPISFPGVVECRPWLRERLLGLYRTLEPLRGTIIHDKHFASSDGAVHVSSSRHGIVGPQVDIEPGQLRSLSQTVVSVLRYIDGTWPIDEYREKQLRYAFDGLTQLHGCPDLSQERPFYTTVRVYSGRAGLRAIHPHKIQADLTTPYGTSDCMFDLRVILVEAGAVTDAFLLPWPVLRGSVFGTLGDVDLEAYRIAIPDDIDPKHFRQNG